MATVETMALAIVALLGLWALRRFDAEGRAVAQQKGTAPVARPLRSPAARWGAALAGWVTALVLLLPHATLIVVSFVPTGTWTTELIPPSYSVSNYVSLFQNAEHLRPIRNSFIMAVIATLAAVAVALIAGRIVVAGVSRLRGTIDALLAAPWALPGTVFAIALATMFSVHQPFLGRWVLVGTFWILPLAYIVRVLPLTGRAIIAGYRQLDPALDEAAVSLGASKFRILRKITVPLLRPAIAAGASLAFITAFGDFVTSIVLYTFETRPISIEILGALRDFNMGIAAAFGVLLMALSGGAFALGERR